MMDDLDTLRTMARRPHHYSNYTLAGALHQVLDRLKAAEAREAGLREALSEFADPDSWWMADAVNIHGHPIKAKAWKFGTNPWTEAQKALALSAAPPREAETE